MNKSMFCCCIFLSGNTAADHSDLTELMVVFFMSYINMQLTVIYLFLTTMSDTKYLSFP